MKAKNMDELRRLIQRSGMNMNPDGVVNTTPEPTPVPAPIPAPEQPRNDELIAAVQSLETAVRVEKKDSDLLDAVKSLEAAIRAPRRWEFTVDRNFEGITKIVAVST